MIINSLCNNGFNDEKIILNPEAPIGMFDSGIGGLNVLKRAVKKLPRENFVYLGDNENAPYGNKSESELFALAVSNINNLLNYNVKAIVIACNTVSSAIYCRLQTLYRVPLIPTLPPIIKNKTRRTLLMCTPNTAKSEYVKKNYAFAQVLPLPFLAAEIERYLYNKDNLAASIENSGLNNINLDKDLRGAYGVYDTVVLGCTHYSFLSREIAARFPHAKIVGGESGAAAVLKRTLISSSLLNPQNERGTVKFIGASAQKNEQMFDFVQN